MEGHVHPDFGLVTEKLDQLMRSRKAFGGAAVAVFHRGELVVDAWTGERDAAGRPWERDTMALSFSTTKGVVATLVHRLVDQGLLGYDQPVATYWPEFATAGKADITLRQLLTHSAGLHDVRARWTDARGEEQRATLHVAVGARADIERAGATGADRRVWTYGAHHSHTPAGQRNSLRRL